MTIVTKMEHNLAHSKFYEHQQILPDSNIIRKPKDLEMILINLNHSDFPLDQINLFNNLTHYKPERSFNSVKGLDSNNKLNSMISMLAKFYNEKNSLYTLFCRPIKINYIDLSKIYKIKPYKFTLSYNYSVQCRVILENKSQLFILKDKYSE
jgi:hypothetical protein